MIEMWDDADKVASYIKDNGMDAAVDEIVAMIKNYGYDAEVAHGIEDTLYVAVLKLVCLVADDPARRLAAAALKAQ